MSTPLVSENQGQDQVSNPKKDQWINIIEDYLTVAELCINNKNPDGSIQNGYAATLLLLCATDAMGHGMLPEDRNKNSRLDILMDPPFNLNLNCSQIANLTKLFRNGLAHVGLMAPDVYLIPESGEPFDFDQQNMLTCIRVSGFYEAVKAAWDKRDKSVFKAQLRPAIQNMAQKIMNSPGNVSSLSPGASGRSGPLRDHHNPRDGECGV